MKQGAEAVRHDVAQAYAEAVRKETCCRGNRTPKGTVANLAGYGEEVASLPQDAVTNSFGCGNPLAFAGVVSGQTVLDLGSGAGIDLLLAAEKVGPQGHVIGVDMTDEMIDRARKNIEKAGAGNVDVRKGLIEQLPVEDNSVDWVISNCVINLSPEKDRVFAEIARVLRPGGRVSISDIVIKDELPPFAREHPGLYTSCIAGAINERDYLAGLEKAGLEQVAVTERLVYDEDQLKAFARSEELPGVDLTEAQIDDIAEAMVGKVWSAKVIGVRAAST
jgi:arsenite methyltransferase